MDVRPAEEETCRSSRQPPWARHQPRSRLCGLFLARMHRVEERLSVSAFGQGSYVGRHGAILGADVYWIKKW